MNKDELKKYLDERLGHREIAKILGVSRFKVGYWARKFGLKTFKKQAKHRCRFCAETNPKEFYGHKKDTCGKCHKKYTREKFKDNKKRARAYLGDKCKTCGFDKYPCSLDFHHLDPSVKDSTFGSMGYWSWERTENEIKGCILLCKNCHAAHHAGLLEIL